MLFRTGLLLALTGCMTNNAGNVAATKLGDTSHPARRGSPVDEVRAACGDGGVTAAGTMIKRAPYLQQVTTDSAMIGWVTTKGMPDEHVQFASAAELERTMATAEPADAITRSADEVQMWSTLTGLGAASITCYGVEDIHGAIVETTGFRTAPLATSSEPVRFLAFGDSGGGGSDQQALVDQMYTVPYELMIHTGDLAYDNGTISQIEDTVFAVYADILRNIPFFPSAGNHDTETMNGAPFRDVWSLPGAGDRKYYSYDWGRVHFVALDTEASYVTQATWLDEDLAKTTLPWKIVYFHRPPYSSGQHGSDTSLRRAWAPIFERHGVQLVLSGHDHDYERMTPQNGVAYVVTGGGGVGTRPVGDSSFTAFAEEVIHFVYVEVGTDEAVLHAIDASGTEFDSMVIPRG